jgi:hypothetical protein
MKTRSFYKNQEQCGQTVPAPVAASSPERTKFGSFPSSVASIESDEESRVDPDGDFRPDELDMDDDTQSKLTTPPWPIFGNAKARLGSPGSTKAHPSQPSEALTQPTLLLDEPTRGLPADNSSPGSDSDFETEDEMELDVSYDTTAQEDNAQQGLRRIATQLFANRQPNMIKPAPAGQPAVWADGR